LFGVAGAYLLIICINNYIIWDDFILEGFSINVTIKVLFLDNAEVSLGMKNLRRPRGNPSDGFCNQEKKSVMIIIIILWSIDSSDENAQSTPVKESIHRHI